MRLCRSYPSLQWQVSELYLQFETLNYCCKHFKRLFLFTGICLCERTHVCVGALRGQKRVLDAMELERGWLQSAPHGCEELVGSSERAVCILSLWVASPAHWCKCSIQDFLNTLYVLNLPSGYTYQCYVITILQAHTTEHGELHFLVHQCGFIGILVSFLVGGPVMDHFQMWNNELQDQSPPL